MKISSRISFFLNLQDELALGTWSFLVKLIENLPSCHYNVLLSFEENPKLINESYSYETQRKIIKNRCALISKWRDSGIINHYEITEFSIDELPDVISSILQHRCQFSDSEYHKIHELTKGHFFFLNIVILYFKQKGLLDKKGSIISLKGEIEERNIVNKVRLYIAEEIERVYREIKNSKPAMEAASIVGDSFIANPISAITNLKDTNDIFFEIEKSYDLISRIFDDNSWVFNNSQTRLCIYKSLGNSAMVFHKKYALYLIDSGNIEYSVIAHHFHKANCKKEYVIFSYKHIENMLEYGEFRQALSCVEELDSFFIGRKLSFTVNELGEFKLIKARVLFHNHSYHIALACLNGAIDLIPDSVSYIAFVQN